MMTVLFLSGLAFIQAKDDVDLKLREFADQMKAAKSDGERLTLMDGLAATRSIKAASKLTAIITGPYSDTVRAGAADAVARTGEVKAGAGLQSVLSSFGGLLQSQNPNRTGDQKVAEAVVRAIGDLRDHSAVPQLTHMLISANIPLMGECVRSLGKIRDTACMEGLLKLHYAANAPEGGGATNPRKPLAPDTLAALRRITGQQFTTPDEWNKWWRTSSGSFRQPPEDAPAGLPRSIRSFAVFSGKGETAALRKFDLVLLDPAAYTKDELAGLRAIALSGEPKAALDKGFAGFVVAPEEAQEMRRKYPSALLVSRGAAPASGAVNAVLVEDLDAEKPDAKQVSDLKEAHRSHETATLWVVVAEKKEDAAAAAKLARSEGFLLYVAPDKGYSKVTPP